MPGVASPSPWGKMSLTQDMLMNADEEADEMEAFILSAKSYFSRLSTNKQRRHFLAEMLELCDNQLLSFVGDFVSPRLKRDPFAVLPNELCLKVLSFIDDPKTLARASQVSTRWHDLLCDDLTWKLLCDKHAYRRLSEDSIDPYSNFPQPTHESYAYPSLSRPSSRHQLSEDYNQSASRADANNYIRPRKRQKAKSYRSHFKQKYMVDAAWRKGGQSVTRHVTPDQAVVTSLHLTPKYIIVALDNAKIHIFSPEGEFKRTLKGHMMGVWAMVPWGDILVSGGCDRDVRVWNMETGKSLHKMRGHTSTVRCLKMYDSKTAISGSRDTTLRVWDIERGEAKEVLQGHSASVRCLAIHKNKMVSGSYDTTARIWNIEEARCEHVLQGHYSQIYAIAFDGVRVVTGSLDTSVRIWDAHTGACQATLQGHTSLVGKLQMRGDTLVTGGSDGSIRVWSLSRRTPIHRLVAHDNSITSLQFDSTRIVSGGSDGRVKVWDLQSGALVRELGQSADAVWRVAFEEEKAVIMATRGGRTFMEVWSFAAADDEDTNAFHAQHRTVDDVRGSTGGQTTRHRGVGSLVSPRLQTQSSSSAAGHLLAEDEELVSPSTIPGPSNSTSTRRPTYTRGGLDSDMQDMSRAN
ncbi:hypothetical protein KEM55_005415 [Ascosphaera atra]|nr:hypothetical protein KEM55_005415 [Ascosphaera atra]